jgi:hypothetical protein
MKKNPEAKLKDVLKFVRSIRNIVNPNPGFMDQLICWERKLGKDLLSMDYKAVIAPKPPACKPM